MASFHSKIIDAHNCTFNNRQHWTICLRLATPSSPPCAARWLQVGVEYSFAYAQLQDAVAYVTLQPVAYGEDCRFEVVLPQPRDGYAEFVILQSRWVFQTKPFRSLKLQLRSAEQLLVDQSRSIEMYDL